MVVTEDGDKHTFAPSPASMTALLALAKTGAILLWDPEARTLIGANVVGTGLAPTGIKRVEVTTRSSSTRRGSGAGLGHETSRPGASPSA